MNTAIAIFYQFLRGIYVRAVQIAVSAKFNARGANIASTAKIVIQPNCQCTFEQSVNVGHGALIVVSTGITANGNAENGKLHVGTGTSINEYANIRASGSTVSIGKNCLIAQHVSIIGSGHGIEIGAPIILQKQSRKSGVTVGNDVWIGCNSVLLPGVCIEDGAVIGAGSVVTSKVSENEIWAGVPARRIGKRRCSESLAQSAG